MSAAAICHAVAAGTVVLMPDGSVDVELSDEIWARARLRRGDPTGLSPAKAARFRREDAKVAAEAAVRHEAEMAAMFGQSVEEYRAWWAQFTPFTISQDEIDDLLSARAPPIPER